MPYTPYQGKVRMQTSVLQSGKPSIKPENAFSEPWEINFFL